MLPAIGTESHRGQSGESASPILTDGYANNHAIKHAAPSILGRTNQEASLQPLLLPKTIASSPACSSPPSFEQLLYQPIRRLLLPTDINI
ncbi:hypothetical protein TNCV_1051461 [Trichonephila clavipes]|nr:hypothetical protein TNCV_1051461 [Trichonephila clavipes]